MTISERTYADANKIVTCRYSFENPSSELTAETLLKYGGLLTKYEDVRSLFSFFLDNQTQKFVAEF